MSTFAIKADKFVLPGATMQGGYITVCDDVFGSWSAEAPEGVEVRTSRVASWAPAGGHAHPRLP